MNVTRRAVLGGAASAAALALTPVRVVAQSIEDVFRIQDDPRNPDNFTYDMFAWAGTGWLAFDDTGTDIARWGDDNPPTEAPAPAADDTFRAPIRLDIPTRIDIPLTLNLRTMAIGTGNAVFVVGILGLGLLGSWTLRNWAAGAMWGLAFIILIVGSLFGLGLEVFWMSMVAVFMLLVAGMVVRWST